MAKFLAILALATWGVVVTDAGPFRRGVFRQSDCAGGSCQVPSIAAPIRDADEEKAPSGITIPPAIPTAQPAEPGPEPKEEPPANFGVEWDKLEHHKVTFNGRGITCDQAIERIGSQVPDDKNKLRLVVIGSKAETEPVRKEWLAADQALRDKVVPWFVAPDHWSLKDAVNGEPRFAMTGHPTIYLLAPDGESLHRQDDFTGSQDLEAIRKGVKAYDARKDKDLRKPQPPDERKPLLPILPDVSGQIKNGLLAIGVMAAGIILVTRRTQ